MPSLPSRLVFAHDHLALDSCCLLALRASGLLRPMLEQIRPRCVVPLDVQREVRSFDFTPKIEAGLLHLEDVSGDEEEEAFVRLSLLGLHNGEAACMALALCRNWAIATDDNKALKVLGQREPRIQVITTPDLVHHWAHAASATRDEVRLAVSSIRWRTPYHPPTWHPLREWWALHEDGPPQSSGE